MRVLIVTKIFPNRLEPDSSPFNRQQFAALSRKVDVEVFATIPWFPSSRHFRRWSRAGRLVAVPQTDSIDGVTVKHPRVAYVPKIGNVVSGPLYAASIARRALPYRGRVDVVLGSWAYPDGYAAVVLAALLGVPAVVKLHGSDINVLAKVMTARHGIVWTLEHAARVVAVSRSLAERAVELGASRDLVDVVPNGVDTQLFRPRDRREARRSLGVPLDRPIALYVGRVEREKGVLDLIHAFACSATDLGRAELWIVGEGAALQESRELAWRLGICARFVGARPHDEVPRWLAACDLLVLPSWNEGMPNAVLEALCSGRRVVATSVGGIPDVVTSSKLGALVPPRSATALAVALERELRVSYDPAEVAACTGVMDWSVSAAALEASLLRALESRARRAA